MEKFAIDAQDGYATMFFVGREAIYAFRLSDQPKRRLRSFGLFSVPAPSTRIYTGRRGFFDYP
jgi:hypothetical protein